MSDPTPMKVVCAGCGKDRTVPSTMADPGPCSCGSTVRTTEALLGVVTPLELELPRTRVRSSRPDLPPAA